MSQALVAARRGDTCSSAHVHQDKRSIEKMQVGRAPVSGHQQHDTPDQ
jgi:hypothetical protein